MTVLVVAYFGKRWLSKCLDTLAGASRNRIRLCLVDNSGNEDSIPKNLEQFEFVPLRTSRPMGFAEANNFALQEAGLNGEFICFLNQDTISTPGWLDSCISCFDNDPRLGAVSPLLKTYDGSGWDPGFWDCARGLSGFMEATAANGELEPCYGVSQVTGAAMIVRSSVLRAVGPFDPIFGSYYEDYDLCRRIREAGYRLGICANGAVWHFSGSSTTSESARRKRMRQVIRNRTILRIREAKGQRWREIARYAACTMPINFGRAIARTPSSQPLIVQLRAHWDLLVEWRRLVSERQDLHLWIEYLNRIGWLLDTTATHQGPAGRENGFNLRSSS